MKYLSGILLLCLAGNLAHASLKKEWAIAKRDIQSEWCAVRDNAKIQALNYVVAQLGSTIVGKPLSEYPVGGLHSCSYVATVVVALADNRIINIHSSLRRRMVDARIAVNLIVDADTLNAQAANALRTHSDI